MKNIKKFFNDVMEFYAGFYNTNGFYSFKIWSYSVTYLRLPSKQFKIKIKYYILCSFEKKLNRNPKSGVGQCNIVRLLVWDF